MLARGASKMRGSRIRELLDRAWKLEAQGRTVVHLGVGQPNFASPPCAVEAARSALGDRAAQGYVANAGIASLRDAVATQVYGKRSPAAALTADNIVVTTGSMLAFYTTFASVLDPGDEVLLPNPGYENYALATELLGAKAVYYALIPPTSENPTWGAPSRAQLDALATPRTKLVVVCTPSNPTGCVFSKEELQTFVDLARDLPKCLLLSDEIYGGIYYCGKSAPSVFDCDVGDGSRVAAVSGVSKEFAMTGFRVGWLATKSAELLQCATKLQEPLVSCGVPFAQAGAEAALRSPNAHAYAAEMRDAYRSRRDAAVNVLRNFGAYEYTPDGAFYLLVGTRGRDSMDFARHLLEKRGVAVAPGCAFGTAADHYVRVSLAAHEDDIHRGLTALCEELAR
ncbi:pyridoxal phosphate-dependent transferase [Pelagophyceae sp. CCMP2097]|nr:pyridoxal phosphate-dependent transferase [Pelagophyceae sp. CCMP2097]